MQTLENMLVEEYNKKGRPGQGLSVETMELMLKMIFRGQDSYKLVAHKNTFFLQNGQQEVEIQGTDGITFELCVDMQDGRCYIKDAADQRLAATKTYCDTLLAPVVNVKEVTRDSIRSTFAFQSILPESHGPMPAAIGEADAAESAASKAPAPTPTPTPPPSTPSPSSGMSPSELVAILAAAGLNLGGLATIMLVRDLAPISLQLPHFQPDVTQESHRLSRNPLSSRMTKERRQMEA